LYKCLYLYCYYFCLILRMFIIENNVSPLLVFQAIDSSDVSLSLKGIHCIACRKYIWNIEFKFYFAFYHTASVTFFTLETKGM
jgi:hypothetical protein